MESLVRSTFNFSSMFQLIVCFLLIPPRPCVDAVDVKTTPSLSQSRSRQMAAFTFPSPCQARSSYKPGTFQLQAESTNQHHSLFDMVKDAALGTINNGDIESVQDFDADLASEIEDALLSAGVGGSNDILQDVIGTRVRESAKVLKENVRPPIQNKTPKEPELPPHTALAQVLANQYGIDLNAISPSSNAPGSKITAEDVEYYAWKISQPPCTSEALELAHSLGLDLNELYDDEDREYVIELSDVQLYKENSRSLRMSSQTKKGVQSDLDPESRKQAKKIRALDNRVEKNMGKLSEQAMKLAGTVTGGIVQQVQQAIGLNGSEIMKGGRIFADMNSKTKGDIKTVEDFDTDLANEIQEALSSANFNCDSGKESDAVEQSSAGFIEEEFEIDSVELSPVEFTEGELQSMTCVQLKEQLRQRGMKVSGKKAELVERLLEGDQSAATHDDSGADVEKSSPSLFFASPQ